MKHKDNPPPPLPPIIHLRIPSSLQQVFIESNRGQIVDVPPHSADVSICRNWYDISSSKRRSRQPGTSIRICEDTPNATLLRKQSSLELTDDTADSTTISDISDSAGCPSDDDSSIDSVDMDFLEKVMKMEITAQNRWEAGNHDVSPQKRIERKVSNPDMQLSPPTNNRWVDGIPNPSTVKQRRPPRRQSPLQNARNTVAMSKCLKQNRIPFAASVASPETNVP